VARETGILEDWHDARGFGFIRRPDGSKIYVHMKSIGKSTERPQAGNKLSYEVGEGSNGRPSAIKVRLQPGNSPKPAASPSVTAEPPAAVRAPGPAAAPAPVQPPARPTPPPKPRAEPGMRHISMRTAAAATIIVLLGNNIMLERLPVWVGLLYVIGSIASWMFYKADKRAAERRQWRAPERRLHLADLTFGIIGGLLAQHVLRHKTYKPGFVTVTALITALHVLTLGLIMFGLYAPGVVGDFFRRTFHG
jgi:uncharacterized membrane protein YsdA (DUF1294 family)/cold shock CspA family protein